ncbi:hypothetical protein BV25DRAFT_1825662 [Artomyces pyxidatus]|uniref:Uncharacterized protein n=1 Tax=Artomyces pyxidatus TaxID=48021 RepID=A0ACB8T1Y7_9AGAM|nr:hypothetical protein BV25DRAFT_1825662 [Artomyces pyxidatus]
MTGKQGGHPVWGIGLWLLGVLPMMQEQRLCIMNRPLRYIEEGRHSRHALLCKQHPSWISIYIAAAPDTYSRAGCEVADKW